MLFSDESIFTSKRVLNRQNCRRWEPTNPHWIREINAQDRWSVMVWAGIVGGRTIGPFFFENNVNGQAYADLLRNHLPVLLNEAGVPAQIIDRLWFQQDGAPAHRANIVTECLNELFADHWVGMGGEMYWPAYSPDWNPLDFAIWGIVKDYVYKRLPETEEQMRILIQEAFDTIPQQKIINCHRSFQQRVRICIDEDGHRFEHFLHCNRCNAYRNVNYDN